MAGRRKSVSASYFRHAVMGVYRHSRCGRAHAIRLQRRHRESGSANETRKRDTGYRRLPDAEKPHELELMTIANQATLKVYEAVYKALAPGMTQGQAGAFISAAYAARRFPRRRPAWRSALRALCRTAAPPRKSFARARSSCSTMAAPSKATTPISRAPSFTELPAMR